MTMTVHEFRPRLGDRIMFARRQADLTQEELADQLDGYSSSDVSRWEKGRREPKLSILSRIADVCRAPWLLDLREVADPSEPAGREGHAGNHSDQGFSPGSCLRKSAGQPIAA